MKKKLSFIISSFLLLLPLCGCGQNDSGIDLSSLTSMAPSIEASAKLKNGVNAFYGDPLRQSYTIDNQSISLTHGLQQDKFVTGLDDKNGNHYIFNSLDCYIVSDGEYMYAKDSEKVGRVNTTRLGYYFYEAHVRDLDFSSYIPLCLDKTYYTYSDRLYTSYRLLATGVTNKMQRFGMEAKFRKKDIDGFLIYDGSSHSSISSLIEKEKVKYVAVNTLKAGVIGFMRTSDIGDLIVSEDDKFLYVRQEISYSLYLNVQESLTIGNRIYTDSTHSFDGIKAAYAIESNPLDSSSISVVEEDGSSFLGYDSLSGAYKFSIGSQTFNSTYFKKFDNGANPDYDKRFYEKITITPKDNRLIYLWINGYRPNEGATIIDDKDVQIPLPIQCSKNFGHEKEEPVYDPGDGFYGDSYMPYSCVKDKKTTFTLIHVSLNWGKSMIKQLSSISYFISYYHLSTGVTETNCIAPYFCMSQKTLFPDWLIPDFRAASGDMWDTGDPQFNSVGCLYSPSNMSRSVSSTYKSSSIRSSGLTHADLDSVYVSDDGAYEYSLRHVELPQNDENRLYYSVSFKMLQDVTLKSGEFSVFSLDSRNATYKKAAYLSSDGSTKTVTAKIKEGESDIYPLHDGTSFFTLMDMLNPENYENDNFALFVKSSSYKGNNVPLSFLNSFTDGKSYGALTLRNDMSLKAGETMSFDIILLPYGRRWNYQKDESGEVIYYKTDYKGAYLKDAFGDYIVSTNPNEFRKPLSLTENPSLDVKAVESVYFDSVINPVKVKAINGSNVTDGYIPTVKCLNNSASFYLSGGQQKDGTNVKYAIKAKGFTKLGNPVVEKLVNGIWETYDITSSTSYDGYSVYYEDGSLTYSLVLPSAEKQECYRIAVK